MARYEVEIVRSAEKQLRRLPPTDRERAVSTIASLATNPLPKGVRKLSGYDDVFRVRFGRYRVLYSISEQTLTILILKVGHRRSVYR
ncbi:MAG: type II toxin-antitoxin system RelE/ParE family toxin [Gammaproteobacteria bacterium]|nr:type II toxin-antitoxin system RelE/ParE family toxin [Gammaproteobacteria bacterium]